MPQGLRGSYWGLIAFLEHQVDVLRVDTSPSDPSMHSSGKFTYLLKGLYIRQILVFCVYELRWKKIICFDHSLVCVYLWFVCIHADLNEPSEDMTREMLMLYANNREMLYANNTLKSAGE